GVPRRGEPGPVGAALLPSAGGPRTSGQPRATPPPDGRLVAPLTPRPPPYTLLPVTTRFRAGLTRTDGIELHDVPRVQPRNPRSGQSSAVRGCPDPFGARRAKIRTATDESLLGRRPGSAFDLVLYPRFTAPGPCQSLAGPTST